MSDNIPFKIQVEIIKRLPVKSLIQLRSVSKPWKSLIDSSDFIVQYSTKQTQPQHLLVCYDCRFVDDMEKNHVSIVDDDTFPHHKVSMTIPFDRLKYCSIIGCSHGLLCLSGEFQEDGNDPTNMAVICNMSIRKAVKVVIPDSGDWMYTTHLGFGVCRETTDPKIVKIKDVYPSATVTLIPDQVEVFTVSSGAWRRPLSNHLPRKTITFGHSQLLDLERLVNL